MSTEAKDEYMMRKHIERFLKKYPHRVSLSTWVLANGQVFDVYVKRRNDSGSTEAEKK